MYVVITDVFLLRNKVKSIIWSLIFYDCILVSKRRGRHGLELVRGVKPTTDVLTDFRNLNVFVKNKKWFSRTQSCRGTTLRL
jgi:hypothetical protein